MIEKYKKDNDKCKAKGGINSRKDLIDHESALRRFYEK
jgi:hypothetical protein